MSDTRVPGAVSAALEALPSPLAAALRTIWDLFPEARLVGGAVRDLYAGRAVCDLDLATPRPPRDVLAAIEAAGLTAIPTGLAHGTVSAMVGAERVELTTLRRDVETDGRHARVEWTDDWHADAARRDFTFNAMSLGRDGVLHDPFGGLDDLRAGRVRFVGAPALRIAEDRLRVLRYFRFLARYGGGSPPDPEAVAAIVAARDDLGALSAERVWSELKRLFETPAIAGVVALMARLGLWRALLGAGLRGGSNGGEAELLLRLEASHGDDDLPPAPVRLAALVAPGAAGQVGARLRLSKAETGLLAALIARESLSPGAADAALRAALDAEPATVLAGRAWLGQAVSRGQPDPLWTRLRERLAAVVVPPFPLTGADALDAGIPRGRAVGEALAHVRHWWRAAGCAPDRAACLAELARLR